MNGPELLARSRANRANRANVRAAWSESSGLIGASLLAACAESAGYAMLADDADSLSVLERLSVGIAARSAKAIGDQSADIHSQALHRAAWAIVSDAAEAPTIAHRGAESREEYLGRLLARSVKSAYESVRATINRGKVQTPSDIGQSVYADWTPTRRIDHAAKYTMGDLSALSLAAATTAADAILIARQDAGSAVPLVRGKVGRPSVANDPTLDASLASSARAAETVYFDSLRKACLSAAFRLTFGPMLPRVWRGYRSPRIAKTDAVKRTGKGRPGTRRGDILRPRGMAWGKVTTGQDATTTRRMVRSMASDAVRLADRMADGLLYGAESYPMALEANVHHAWTLDSVTALDSTLLDWTPTPTDVAAFKASSAKRTDKVLKAISDGHADILGMTDMLIRETIGTAARVAPYETAGRNYGDDRETPWAPYAVKCVRCSLPLVAPMTAVDGMPRPMTTADNDGYAVVCTC